MTFVVSDNKSSRIKLNSVFFNLRKNNEDIVKKISEIRVKGIMGKCMPKKKMLIEVIEEWI